MGGGGVYDTVEAYIDDVRDLGIEGVRARHGDAFLLHEGTVANLRAPPRPMKTLQRLPAVGQHRGMTRHYLVFAVRSTGRCPFPNMISIGRTSNNDIHLPDISLSKFHAFFRDQEGELVLHDAGSSNGTTVNGKPLLGKGKGPGVAVRPKDVIVLGSVTLQFLDAEELCRVVRAVS